MVGGFYMQQTFHETSKSSGEVYTITAFYENEHFRMSCTCMAGQNRTLCKHVTKVILENDALLDAIKKENYYELYNEFITKSEEAEQLKREAAKAKKAFSKAMLRS